MLSMEMHVEAVDLVCAFGLEDEFSPASLLTSFVKMTCEVAERERREGQGSLRRLVQSNSFIFIFLLE